ncbi:hypothetical protein LJE71_00430, partial [Xanthobacter autotrophicus]|uniref:hypothetical protein n=1 Tax=Xanthobacter autotrophicus TaxID=280 RepID=UPI001E355C22
KLNLRWRSGTRLCEAKMRIVFRLVCLFVAVYFGVAFFMVSGYPPRNIMEGDAFIYIILVLIFLLLIFVDSFELIGILKYKSLVENVKTDVKEFKDEVRSIISMQNSIINSVSQSVNNNVTVYQVPSTTQAKVAEGELAEAAREISPENDLNSSSQFGEEVSNFIAKYDGDHDVALMKIRRDIESELRRILNKKVDFQFSEARVASRNVGISTLWRQVRSSDARLVNMDSAFRYVVDICNAAAHGQVVPPANAEEAIGMGLELRRLLGAIG